MPRQSLPGLTTAYAGSRPSDPSSSRPFNSAMVVVRWRRTRPIRPRRTPQQRNWTASGSSKSDYPDSTDISNCRRKTCRASSRQSDHPGIGRRVGSTDPAAVFESTHQPGHDGVEAGAANRAAKRLRRSRPQMQRCSSKSNSRSRGRPPTSHQRFAHHGGGDCIDQFRPCQKSRRLLSRRTHRTCPGIRTSTGRRLTP